MNPFRLVEGAPRNTLRRLGAGLAGLLLLLLAIRQVRWGPFQLALAGLRWRFLVASLGLGLVASLLRALRLGLLLRARGKYVTIWRCVALCNLGTYLLPLGGGEFLKIGLLGTLLGTPAARTATGSVLDRLFDLLGLASLLAVLVVTGTALPVHLAALRTRSWLPPLLAVLVLVLALALRLKLRQRSRLREAFRPGWLVKLDRILEQAPGEIARGLAPLVSPALLARVLATQGCITLLEVSNTWLALRAFPFGRLLPLLAAVKLGAYLMLGAALPLLPGGLGTHQVACILALQPAGVTATEAFAFSLATMALSFLFTTALGLVAALGLARSLDQTPPQRSALGGAPDQPEEFP